VLIVSSGAVCSRSLACKSHSVAAKRAVHGRSLPYDTLLNLQATKVSKKGTACLKLDRLAVDADLASSVESQTKLEEEPRLRSVPRSSDAAPLEYCDFKPIVSKSWFLPGRKHAFCSLKSILEFPLKIQKRWLHSKRLSGGPHVPTGSSAVVPSSVDVKGKKIVSSFIRDPKRTKYADDAVEGSKSFLSMPSL
jgi:hypothetical protein